MKGIIFCIVSILFALTIQAQESDTVFFEKEYTAVAKYTSVTPVYKLVGDTLYYRSEPYKIKLPKNIDTSELAFCFVYFTGWEDLPISQNSVLLISGFKSFKSKIYVDDNQNLDFSDDGEPLPLNGLHDVVIISFVNSTNSKALFNIDLKYAEYFNEDHREQNVAYYTKHNNGKGNQLLDSKFWFTDRRLNSLVKVTKFKGDSLLIGIHDANCDGFYNKLNSDKIMLGNYLTAEISSRSNEGAYTFSDTTVLKINDQFYTVADIEETGRYLVLNQTNLESNRLETGDTIPNFSVKLIDGSVMKIHDLLVSDKYTLIDIWGTWCAGCVSQTDELLRIESAYKSKLQILALDEGDPAEKIKKYISAKKISWPNAYASEEIQNAFHVDGFPFLILVDQNMKIVKIQTTINEVEKLISKE